MNSRPSPRTRGKTTRGGGSTSVKRKAARGRSTSVKRKTVRGGGSVKNRRKSSGRWHRPVLRIMAITTATLCLGVFCYWAATVTFTPIDDGGQAVGNTDIGHSLRFYLDRPSVKEAARQVGGNLVLLAPLGILLPMVFARLHTPSRMALVALLSSAAVETVQGAFIAGRAFDIDDILLNVTGILIAYLLAGRRMATLVRGRVRA